MTTNVFDSTYADRNHLTKVREKLYQARNLIGKKVGVRLDIPSARRGIPVVSIHATPHGGVVMGYDHSCVLEDATFIIQPGGMKSVGAEGGNKFPFAFIGGTLVEADLNDTRGVSGTPTQIYYNPRRVHLFVEAETGRPVKGARVVYQVGDITYGLGVEYYGDDAPAVPEGMTSMVGVPVSNYAEAH